LPLALALVGGTALPLVSFGVTFGFAASFVIMSVMGYTFYLRDRETLEELTLLGSLTGVGDPLLTEGSFAFGLLIVGGF